MSASLRQFSRTWFIWQKATWFSPPFFLFLWALAPTLCNDWLQAEPLGRDAVTMWMVSPWEALACASRELKRNEASSVSYTEKLGWVKKYGNRRIATSCGWFFEIEISVCFPGFIFNQLNSIMNSFCNLSQGGIQGFLLFLAVIWSVIDVSIQLQV